MTIFITFLQHQSDCSKLLFSFLDDIDLLITLRLVSRKIINITSYLQNCLKRSQSRFKIDVTLKCLFECSDATEDTQYTNSSIITRSIVTIQNEEEQINMIRRLANQNVVDFINWKQIFVHTLHFSVCQFILEYIDIFDIPYVEYQLNNFLDTPLLNKKRQLIQERLRVSAQVDKDI